MPLLQLLWVGAGGFVGAVGRYLLGGAVHRVTPAAVGFPTGTLVVNVIGCLAIGLLGGLAEVRGVLSADARRFLLIGLLGGFTTFSTFGWETVMLLRDGSAARAALNVVLQVGVGLVAVWLGLSLAASRA